MTVCIYYFDDSEDAGGSGWWFGCEVGGDEVFAYSAAKSVVPPVASWHIPFDADEVDKRFRVRLRGTAAEPVQKPASGAARGQTHRSGSPVRHTITMSILTARPSHCTGSVVRSLTETGRQFLGTTGKARLSHGTSSTVRSETTTETRRRFFGMGKAKPSPLRKIPGSPQQRWQKWTLGGGATRSRRTGAPTRTWRCRSHLGESPTGRITKAPRRVRAAL